MRSRERQERLLRSLRRSGTSTVAQLAEAVGVSRRTVLRDIVALRDEGHVIHADPGPGGGLSLDLQRLQTSPRLSVAEVFALLISVASMRAANTLPFAGLADAGLAKIEQALPREKQKDLRQFLDCLYVGTLAPAVDISNLGQMDPGVLAAFEPAFLNRWQLRFCYRDAKGKVSDRQVEPQAMLILPPLWYLVAWDPQRQDFRHFRMDRITAPECLEGESFQRRRVPFADGVRPVQQRGGRTPV